MGPVKNSVASPAVFSIHRFHFHIFHNDFPEAHIIVRIRSPVAQVAVGSIGRGVPVARYFPGPDAVTRPASLSEKSLMGIKVTLGTQQFFVEKGVLHLGYTGFHKPVLLVAGHAFLPGFVETDLSSQQARIDKIVAFKTSLHSHALPRFMTEGAVSQFRMGKA
jgi:hypothetical protein